MMEAFRMVRWALAGVMVAFLAGCEDGKTSASAETTTAPLEVAKPVAVASMDLQQTQEERAYLGDPANEWGRFYRYAARRYPDIARVKVPRNPALAGGDKEDLALYAQDFRFGLYFAKQIVLANGQTLFDFLTKCSQGMGNADGASIGVEGGGNYVHLQYFPVLKQSGSKETVELQILLKRRGNRIEAASPLFSTSILKNADFMQEHGVECWHRK